MTNWNDFLKRDDIQNEIKKIESFLDEEREKFDGLLEVLPRKENIYKVFDLTDFDSIKVVLIGQDPYHNIEIIKHRHKDCVFLFQKIFHYHHH